MKPLRILLLEPRAVPCGSLTAVLGAAGHVVVAMNDLGVLAHLDTFIQVDLILVDVGDDVERVGEIEALMAHPKYRHRIVAVICDSLVDHIPRLQRAGMGHVLVKPLDPAELDRSVKALFVAAS